MSFFLNFHILSPRRNFVIEKKSDFFLQILFLNQFNLISLTTKKQTTKFSSANFEKKKKNVKSKLYYFENSKTRGQAV